MNILTVIYDDQCGMCVAARKWAERRCGETVFFFPASRAARLMAVRQIPPKTTDSGVVVLDGETILVGYKAVICILKRSGIPVWMRIVLGMPGVRLLGSLAYRFLATHRHFAARFLKIAPVPTVSGSCRCGGGCS